VKIPIHVTEGETRTLAGAMHGLHVIGLGGKDAGFEKGSHRGALIKWFDLVVWKGRTVYLSLDADSQSKPDVRQSLKALAFLLTKRGAIVHVISLPAIFSANDGLDDLIGHSGIQIYLDLCAASPVWSEESEWPEPQPFYNTLPAVPRMGDNMLPEALHDWIADEARRLNVPIEYIGVPAVFALGLAVMTKAQMRPKSEDPWVVPGYMWFAIIAPSGGKKTPALKIAMKPIYAIEERLAKETTNKNRDHRVRRKVFESHMDDWEKQAQDSMKAGKPIPQLPSIQEVPKDPPPPPLLAVNSATVEALQEHLKSSDSAGIGYMRDELAGMLEELEKPGRQGDRAFLLEGMEQGRYSSLRIGRGRTDVPKNAVALGGGIQPTRLNSMILDGLKNGASNDGLLPRLSLLLYPDQLPDDQIAFVNEPPDAEAFCRAQRVYDKLYSLDHKNPAIFKFDVRAQRVYGNWMIHAEKYRRNAEFPDIVCSHFAKYDRLIATLAMLFKLCEQCDDPSTSSDKVVELRHLRMALRWGALLERHAMRMYHARMSPVRAAAQTLAKKIQLGKLATANGVFTLRSVYENDWAGMSTPDEAREVVRILVAYDWAREVPNAEGGRGRPSEQFRLNPKITSTYPEVNADKVQQLIQEADGNSVGFAGCGLVPMSFLEEEEEQQSLIPSTLKTPKNNRKRPFSPPAKLTHRKFTPEYRAASHQAAEQQAAKVLSRRPRRGGHQNDCDQR
jgi:hypothetical protein